MAKLCIICGQRAGSREHVFPAALGGRRTNKGIYCGEHNEAFSPQAAIMAEQLRPINARLSVRSDHSDAPADFVFKGSQGESLVMSGDHITLAGPQVVTEINAAGNRQVEMRFPSRHQADQWLSEQRAAGNHVQLGEVREQTIYQTNSELIRMSYGGRELFRALGYVAMTFLAHHFPNLGRGVELSELKNYCLNNVGDDMVWWEAPDLMSDLDNNPFAFGHTIAISVSAVTNKAYGRISLFSALNFSIFLGHVAPAGDHTTITFIDPLAERPPGDTIVQESESVLFATDRPLVSHARLEEIIENGRAQQSFQMLLNRISRYNFDRQLAPTLNKIIGSVGDPERLRDVATVLVNEQGQRILNLMRHGIAPLRDGFAASPDLSFLAARLGSLIASDQNSSDGLSSEASRALLIAKQTISNEVVRLAERGELSAEQLFLLLNGGPGAALIGRVLLARLIAELPATLLDAERTD